MDTRNEQILADGLHWLFETVQSEGAILQHHSIPLAGVANRNLGFCPSGWSNRAVVILNVAEVEWRKEGTEWTMLNPLEPDELADLTNALARLGEEVVHSWNGHPADSGSVALKRPAHPSLTAAVDLYRAGCPTHPRESVFCKCGWYGRGNALVTYPMSRAPGPAL